MGRRRFKQESGSSNLQAYFEDRTAVEIGHGYDITAYGTGVSGNGLVLKVPRGPLARMQQTVDRHFRMKDCAGGLVVPFQIAKRINACLQRTGGDQAHTQLEQIVVQERISSADLVRERLARADESGDLNRIKELLGQVIDLRQAMLNIGIKFIDPTPSNMVDVGDGLQLMDVSAADALTMADILESNRGWLNRLLLPQIHIITYRSVISPNARTAIKTDWKQFVRGMKSFHDPEYIQRELLGRSALRGGGQKVPNVRIPETIDIDD